MRRGVALVTGASGGFGVHLCAALVARGFRVFACLRDLDKSELVAAAVRERGFEPADPRNLEFLALDLSDADQTHAAVERVLGDPECGAVDVLVNNAGALVSGFAEEIEELELRRQFEVNFFGLVRLTQALLPPMRERRHGRVINMSSIGGRVATPKHSAYHASKFALEGWSEALRYELRPFHVFVSLVEPGYFPTGIWSRNHQRVGESSAGAGPYAKLAARLEREADKMHARMAWANPRVVGETVGRIALTPQPRLRYPVGVDAWAAYLAGPLTLGAVWERSMVRWFGE